jgi:hypothetical protein
LRGLLAPFDYGDIEVRVRISREPTLLGISMREGASACRACTDAVALDVLQEVDQFLQDHREWAVHLDGALLYP